MPGGGGSPQENAQAMAMMMPMLRGLFVDVSLIVDGRVIKTNAPFVSGSQVTLLQFDFDKVSATEGALQKLQQITDPKLLKDIPGVPHGHRSGRDDRVREVSRAAPAA